jgi:translation initiation factor 2 alpha subunit (eIF-2alpha)
MNFKIIKNLRYYEKEYPENNEYVMVKIKKFTEIGIFCKLIEYNKDALLSFKDASSSRRLKTIKKQIDKKKNMIVTVLNVDNEKGFIDVEKRSIDKDEEEKFIDLIKFYYRIFNIFVKRFLLHNNNEFTNESNVYDFLKKTLWLQNPKNIKINMSCIHTNLNKLLEQYNLTDKNKINIDIVDDIKNIIPIPVCKIYIQFKINSLSLFAYEEIKTFVNNVEKKLETKIIVETAPYYSCLIEKKYNNNSDLDNIKKEYNESVKKIIKNNLTEDLFATITIVELKI